MLKVLKSGVYSTIQDNGRFGYRDYGAPISGAMDSYSSQFANALLGNKNSDATIEMTMVGGSFQFLEPTSIVVSGAKMNPMLNDVPIKEQIVVKIRANDILSFGKSVVGFRTYLAIIGGFNSNLVLNSRSQYQNITKSSVIKKGDLINYKVTIESDKVFNASVKFNASALTANSLETYLGPEFNKLSPQIRDELFQTEFIVSKQNNRMAYQLEPKINNNLESIITVPVLPGSVQLTPSGNLIVLMRDCQTTGGYPRILQLTEASINYLSQKTTGNNFKFRLKEF